MWEGRWGGGFGFARVLFPLPSGKREGVAGRLGWVQAGAGNSLIKEMYIFKKRDEIIFKSNLGKTKSSKRLKIILHVSSCFR